MKGFTPQEISEFNIFDLEMIQESINQINQEKVVFTLLSHDYAIFRKNGMNDQATNLYDKLTGFKRISEEKEKEMEKLNLEFLTRFLEREQLEIKGGQPN